MPIDNKFCEGQGLWEGGYMVSHNLLATTGPGQRARQGSDTER
jgi:hypothetical protein